MYTLIYGNVIQYNMYMYGCPSATIKMTESDFNFMYASEQNANT